MSAEDRNAEVAPELVLIGTLERVYVGLKMNTTRARDVTDLETVISKVRSLIVEGLKRDRELEKVHKRDADSLGALLEMSAVALDLDESKGEVLMGATARGHAKVVRAEIVRLRAKVREYEQAIDEAREEVEKVVAMIDRRRAVQDRLGRFVCGTCNAGDAIGSSDTELRCGHPVSGLVWVPKSEAERLVSE